MSEDVKKPVSAAEPVSSRNDEAGYVEFLNEDVPYIVRDIQGAVAILMDLETRNVIGYRVYDPDSVFAPPAPSVAVKAFKTNKEMLTAFGAEDIREGSRMCFEANGEDTWEGYYEVPFHALDRIRSALSAQVQDVAQNGLTLSALQWAHVERQEEWCPDVKPDLSFRGNELGGECGEAQNVIKKLERERHGWRGSRDTVEHLAEELADVIHCSVLVAITAGVDLQQAVIAKFNDTSMKNGLSAMLPAAPTKQEGGE